MKTQFERARGFYKTPRFAHMWQDAESLVPATQNDIRTSKSAPNLVFCTFSLGNVLRATMACTFSTSQLPKVLRTWCVLFILTWKRASRHNGMHFFDISTSKSALNVRCFELFHLQTSTACTFSTSHLPRVLRTWCVFCTFWLRLVLRSTTACNFNFSSGLLFDPPEPQIIGKTDCFATFLPFRAPASSDFIFFDLLSSLFFSLLSSLFSLLSSSLLFCSLLFSSLTLPTPACPSSILSEVRLLKFLRLLLFFLLLLLLLFFVVAIVFLYIHIFIYLYIITRAILYSLTCCEPTKHSAAGGRGRNEPGDWRR